MRETLTITLESEAHGALGRIADAMGTDRETLVSEALTRWLAVQAHQLEYIERGIAEADAGIFGSRPSTWWKFDPRLKWPSVRPPWVEV